MKKIFASVPVWCRLVAVIFVLCGLCHLFAFFFTPFADFLNRTVSSGVRGALALLTAVLPFSLAEMLLLTLPLWLVGLLYGAYRASASREKGVRMLSCLLSVVMLVYCLFFFTLGVGYRTTPLQEQLGLAEEPVNAEQLQQTALWLREEVNRLAPDFETDENGSSVSPLTFRETAESLLAVYGRMAEQYPFLSYAYSRPKPVLLSEPMSYTNITGVYSFFTGEANINVDYPAYTIPYTMAHELAHQRGIIRENEANYMAFLICIQSEEPYIRYSGYVSLLEYVMNALAAADSEKFAGVYAGYEECVRAEMQAYNAYWYAHQHEVVSNISGSINDTYLKINGTPGSVSYGLVVDLAVAYYEQEIR